MIENQSNRMAERQEEERRVRRRVIGFLLLPIALFPFFSLISYNWRDVSMLMMPPLTPPANLIGVFGAWSVFIGYSIIGLAQWCIPFLVLLFSVLLIYGKITHMIRRAFWMLVFLVAFCCLLQLGSDGIFASTLEKLNMRPNAGGAVGYWLMTCLLERWFSPVGASVLLSCIMFLSLLFAIGFRELFLFFGGIANWYRRRKEEIAAREQEERENSPDGLTNKERARIQAQQAKEKARQEREEAARIRAEERAKERAEKDAERKRLREEREKERAKERAEKEAEREKRDEERKQAEEDKRKQREEDEQRRDVKFQQESREQRLRELIQRSKQKAVEERTQQPSRPRTEEEPPAPPPFGEEIPPVTGKIPIVVPTQLGKKPAPEKPATPEPEKKEKEPDAISMSVRPEDQEYPRPPLSLLNDIPQTKLDMQDNITETCEKLVEVLKQFGIDVEVIGTRPGPTVTQYELRPGAGIKVDRIKSFSATLQYELGAESLRIEAPIPGKKAIGIEVPNRVKTPVTFHEILTGSGWKRAVEKMAVPLVLGKDVAGNDLVIDLAEAPHLLVAGSTGSGKSVCLNSMITGLLMSRTPEELRLILVDPKRVEFTAFQDLPHLLVPVINESKKVAFGLRWALVEMDRRYKLLQSKKCRNIIAYNSRKPEPQGELFEYAEKNALRAGGVVDENINGGDPDKLPYIVIIIDEVADIMAAVGKEIEPAISRLCALSRAVGIHLILATQRPSVDVITGTIKANIPGRIAFKVSQANDSRTILDNPGAEELLGKGDMLYLRKDGVLMRAQGSFLDDMEIARVVDFIKQHCRPCYDKKLAMKIGSIKEDTPEDIMEEGAPDSADGSEPRASAGEGEDSEEEKNIQDALDVIRRTHRASTSTLQRRLGFGYNKAARIMDILEERGYIGPSNGAKPREILVDLENEIPTHPGQGAGNGDWDSDDSDIPISAIPSPDDLD
ncbi:MAG: DNA translocase FtsK [Kiritimatiellae bacterium]|nr:DNA translocase FtsK [Kiritimatiellia bacterium]